MKDFINYVIKMIIKGVLHVFCIFPIEKNKITMLNELSFTYGDSLKYIDQYIHHNSNGKYKIVFPIRLGAVLSEFDDDVVVQPKSVRYFKELITSEIIITNAGGVSYLPNRKKQMIISTWHGGGPYKKTSLDVCVGYWYKKQVQMNSDNTDYILSSCKYFSDFEAKSMGFKENEIIPAGLPRNDIMFSRQEKIERKVRDFYSISDDQRFVLFAPTFRSKKDFVNAIETDNYVDLDIEKLISALQSRFGGNWICGVRLHPKLADIDIVGKNVINCCKYPDMQELLCSADVVVSDYSSLIWDFSFTLKPIFLYAPDMESYESEIGFYMPSSEWPFPIAKNNEEMTDNILNFDEEAYVLAVKKHHIAAGSFESGNACHKIMELIEKDGIC